jgi:hypothetical protein
MTTDDPTTGRAAPFFHLSSEEFFHPVLLDSGKIFKKTHSEILLISLIDVGEVLTGIFFAFITEGYRVIL